LQVVVLVGNSKVVEAVLVAIALVGTQKHLVEVGRVRQD